MAPLEPGMWIAAPLDEVHDLIEARGQNFIFIFYGGQRSLYLGDITALPVGQALKDLDATLGNRALSR